MYVQTETVLQSALPSACFWAISTKKPPDWRTGCLEAWNLAAAYLYCSSWRVQVVRLAVEWDSCILRHGPPVLFTAPALMLSSSSWMLRKRSLIPRHAPMSSVFLKRFVNEAAYWSLMANFRQYGHMDKQRWDESDKEKKREDQRRERVRRKKMKRWKSHGSLCFSNGLWLRRVEE